MEIHEHSEDAIRYISKRRGIKAEDKKRNYYNIMSHIRKLKNLDINAKILEIGSGLGWFPILCALDGISCEGIDISPQFVKFSKELGKRYGIELDVKLGNIEKENIGSSKYDVIIAITVFEHVKLWKEGIKRIYNALKPGGLFYFVSTNKFALKSGEFHFPFYSWMPNKLRYQLRIWYHGKDIMKLGIDFNEFFYYQLRRFFLSLGFSKVIDILEVYDINSKNMNSLKKALIEISKKSRIMKNLILFFLPNTQFICIK